MPDVKIKNNKLGKTKLHSGLSIRKGQTLTIPYAVASSPRVQRYIQKGLFSVVNSAPVPVPPPLPERETDPPVEPTPPSVVEHSAPPPVDEHTSEPIIKKKRGLKRKKQSEPE